MKCLSQTQVNVNGFDFLHVVSFRNQSVSNAFKKKESTQQDRNAFEFRHTSGRLNNDRKVGLGLPRNVNIRA